MKGYPKKFALKDGTEVALRPMKEGDLSKLLKFFKGVPEEDRLFLKEDVTKRAVIEKWVTNIDYKKIMPIVAEQKGKIIGDATLHQQKQGWSRHVGEIRMVVAKEFQKKGLGTILARELFAVAIETGLKKLMAQMMETQQGAIHSFAKIGFKKEAVLPGHVIDIAGNKQNLVIMTNDVDDLWRTMEEVYSQEEFSSVQAHL